MSSYYQTTAKPRGRRETGTSDNSTRSRAPSEASNLSKKISRTSDESIAARSANSRPNSPATFLQRHKTLDRPSVPEPIQPQSSSSHPLLKPDASAILQPPLLPVNTSSKPHASTPTSPILTSSKLESSAETKSLHSKTSSKSMTDAANSSVRRSLVLPTSAPPPAAEPAAKTAGGSQTSADRASLQPSVADVSEDNTPRPTPAIEHVHMPFGPPADPEIKQQTQPSSQKSVSPKEKANAFPQTSQAPNQTWYQDQTWNPMTSTPQSPVIHQYGGFQTPSQMQYPYDYSYAYAPHMAPGGYQQYANPYYPAPFSPPTEAAPPAPAERQTSRSGSGDEQGDLMDRLQSVLPDLARLLGQSKEGKAPPAVAEAALIKSQVEQNEQLTSLQQELKATKKEYEKVIRNLVDENCTLKNEAEDRQRRSRSLEGESRGSRKLKSEYEALQAQHQDLASSVDSIRLSKEELMAEKLGVEKHIDSLKKDKHFIKDSHHRAVIELKQQHLQELASRDREHQKTTADHKSALSKVQLDLAALITKHTSTKRDLEITRTSEAAYKASAEARQKELDASRLHHIQHSDRLKADHQRALESLKQEHKSQRQRHEAEIKKYVTDLETLRGSEKEWSDKSRSLEAELHEHKVALATEKDAHTSLKTVHEERNKRTTELAGSMLVWRQKQAELQKENENLDLSFRVLHALVLGTTASEAKAEAEQPAPAPVADAVPPPTEPEKQQSPAEATPATDKPAEGAKEVEAEPTVTTVEPKQEPSETEKKEPSKEVKQETPPELTKEVNEEPKKAAEPAKTVEMAPATATAAPPPPAPEAKASVPVEKPSVSPPAEAVSTRKKENEKEKEKSRNATAPVKVVPTTHVPTHVRRAEEPIVFRPINYYQVPGQFQ